MSRGGENSESVELIDTLVLGAPSLIDHTQDTASCPESVFAGKWDEVLRKIQNEEHLAAQLAAQEC